MSSIDLQEQSRLQAGLLASAEILVRLRKRKLDSPISGSPSPPLLPEGIASVAGQTLPTHSHFKPIRPAPLAEGGSRLHLSSPECSAMKHYEAWRERCIRTSSSSSGGGGFMLIRKDSQELERMPSEESVDRRVEEDAWRWQTCRGSYQAADAIRSNATASHQMSLPTLTPPLHSSSSRHATPLLLPFLHRPSATPLPALAHHQQQPQEEPRRSDTPFPSSASASLDQQIAKTTSIPSLNHRPQQQQQKEETKRSDTPFPSSSSSSSHCINGKCKNPHRQESGSPRPLMAKPRPLWGQPESTSCSNATAITTTAASTTFSCSSSNGSQQQQQRGEEKCEGEGTGGEGGGEGGEGTGEGTGEGCGRRKDEKCGGGGGGGGDSRPDESKMNPVEQQRSPSRRAYNTSNSSKRRSRSNSVSSSSTTPSLSFDGQSSSSSSSQSHYHQHATRRNTSLQHHRNEEVEDGKDGQGRDDGVDVEEEGGVASDSKRQRKIGIYSPEARRKRLERFWEKRKHRIWHQEGVRYAVRKDFAETRIRVKGRFISKKEAALVSLPTITRPNPSASHCLEQENDEEKDKGESIAAAGAAAPCSILSDGNTFLLQKAVVLEQEERKGDKSPVAAAKAVEGKKGFEEEKEKEEEEEEDEEEGDQKDRRLDAAKCLSGLRFSSTY